MTLRELMLQPGPGGEASKLAMVEQRLAHLAQHSLATNLRPFVGMAGPIIPHQSMQGYKQIAGEIAKLRQVRSDSRD